MTQARVRGPSRFATWSRLDSEAPKWFGTENTLCKSSLLSQREKQGGTLCATVKFKCFFCASVCSQRSRSWMDLLRSCVLRIVCQRLWKPPHWNCQLLCSWKCCSSCDKKLSNTEAIKQAAPKTQALQRGIPSVTPGLSPSLATPQNCLCAPP